MDENVREGHNTDLMSNQVDKLIRDVRNTISTLPSDTSGAVVGIEIRTAMPGILMEFLNHISEDADISQIDGDVINAYLNQPPTE